MCMSREDHTRLDHSFPMLVSNQEVTLMTPLPPSASPGLRGSCEQGAPSGLRVQWPAEVERLR